jgi:hypothetical protein
VSSEGANTAGGIIVLRDRNGIEANERDAAPARRGSRSTRRYSHMAQHFDGREDERERTEGDELAEGEAEARAGTGPDHTDETPPELTAALDALDETPSDPAGGQGEAPRRPRKASPKSRQRRHETGEPIAPLPRTRRSLVEEVSDLEAQGFTEDEALQLISVSERVAHSGEAQEAEAALRRLRFTRWLIEHGVLDEFTR